MQTVVELNRLAKDTGCSEYDDCLTCPLPECIYVDKYLTKTALLRANRNEEIRQAAKELSLVELASLFNVSLRTVQRVIRDANPLQSTQPLTHLRNPPA